MADFHFSPRANRAAEIEWMPWGETAFDRAAAEDKPILLGISAVWCHWCHVMDETSYSDSGIIDAINRNFVAVRVDNDERPDVNARYNMGGWPTTAFLTPDGTIITGFTYMPPAQMGPALSEIARFYSERRADIDARSFEMRENRANTPPSAPAELNDAMVEQVARDIADGYDAEFGGFGDAPKFPQPEVLEFLLARWRSAGNPRLYEIVAHTMRAMSSGGMYDHVEGGFFRYSTTRDWSVPHFEKMAEDHAGLVRVLARLEIWSAADEWRATLRSAVGYLRDVLRDADTGVFAGSQDADETYFSLDLPARRARAAPYVDRRSYSNWTAGLAGAFMWAGQALGDDDLRALSLETLDTLHATMRDEGGLLYHVLAPGEPPRIRGLLTDQVAYLRALLDAHELSGEARFLGRAQAHADATIAQLGADDDGFFDHARAEASLGRLDLADRPIVDNAVMAESLVRLATLTGEHRYRDTARRALALYSVSYLRAGQFAAAYARALDRLLAPETLVKLAGELERVAPYRAAALGLPTPYTCIGREPGATTAAYVCRGRVCAPPVYHPAEIPSAYESIAVG